MIKEKQVQTVDKRKEVNELMVKSKLISEEDIQHQNEEIDETLKDLPEEALVSQDDAIIKINGILKSSKKKAKLSKNQSDTEHGRNMSEVEKKIPTTKNALNLRKNEAKESVKKTEPPKIAARPKLTDSEKQKEVDKPVEQFKLAEQEKPTEPEPQSYSKPLIGGSNASKPFGSKISSKPNFLSKAKQETNNATSNISKDYEL